MTLLLYTQNIKRRVLKKKAGARMAKHVKNKTVYVSLRDLRRGAAVSSFSSSSFSTLSPLLPAPSVSVALGFFASTTGFTGACNKQLWVELLFIFRMKRAVKQLGRTYSRLLATKQDPEEHGGKDDDNRNQNADSDVGLLLSLLNHILRT